MVPVFSINLGAGPEVEPLQQERPGETASVRSV
jgi:hypothetical protein